MEEFGKVLSSSSLCSLGPLTMDRTCRNERSRRARGRCTVALQSNSADKQRARMHPQPNDNTSRSALGCEGTVQITRDNLTANTYLSECLHNLDEHIKKRKKKSRKKYLNTASYSTPVFAGGVFDQSGGELVVADGSVRLRVTPDAVKKCLAPYKVYIYLSHDKNDYPKLGIKGTNLSPVVMCGPHGLSFEKPILLTVQTGIKGKYREIKVLKSETKPGEECKWQIADRSEAHCLWNEGRCITAIRHFTLYRVIGVGGESILKGVFKVCVYSSDEKGNSIKFRVRVFPDTQAETQIVERIEQGELLSQQKVTIQHGTGIIIRMENLTRGWSNGGSSNQEVTPGHIWMGESRQQSGVVRTFTVTFSGVGRPSAIEARILVHETGRSDSGVQVAVNKRLSTPSVQGPQLRLQSAARRPAVSHCNSAGVSSVDRAFRNALPEFQRVHEDKFAHIISYSAYVDLCMTLDIKGVCDIRFLADRIGLGTETILYLTENVSGQCRSVAATVLDFFFEQRIQNGLKKKQILEELASLLQDIGHERAASMVRGHIRPKQTPDSGFVSPLSGDFKAFVTLDDRN
ncbi:UNC5C-like protein [Ptychodera flava]|uniref:UNC5C-like protein n=1 Tax=Ptychodera flava TaxID=63121 RepID=UPI00396A6C6F